MMSRAVMKSVVIAARAAAHAFLMATEPMIQMFEELEIQAANVSADPRTPEQQCAEGDHPSDAVRSIPTMGRPDRYYCQRCKQTFDRTKEA